jgi:hypothetical protein
MAFKGEEPRVAESSTSVGAGDFVLAGAITERVRFSAVCAVGDTFDYVIKAADGTWEEGLGTYSAANTLTRTAVKRSTNGNAAVVFAAGNKTVFINFAGLSRAISEADQKNPPTGADKLGIWDSVTGLLAGLTLTNLAAWLASLAQTLTNKTFVAPVLGIASGTSLDLTTAGQTSTLSVTDTGGNGTNLKFTGNGGTTPKKYIRVFSGNMEWLNNAYSAVTMTLTDVGSLTTAAGISAGGTIASTTGSFTAQVATFPNLLLNETSAGSGLKFLRIAGSSGAFKIQKINDSFTTSTDLATVDTSGNLTTGGNITGIGGVVVQSATTPIFQTYESGAGANLKYMRFIANSGVMTLQKINDAYNTFTDQITVEASGHFRPGADNTQTLGSASFRWSTVYAGTGTINTSDGREKTAIAPLTDVEVAAAKDLTRELGGFKFLSSIADKGDAARTHIGMTVQRAIEIMKGHGLDPMAYAFICYDKWEATTREVVSASGLYSRNVTRQVVDLAESHVNVIEIVDGAPVRKARTEITETPRTAMLPVVDEQGQPVMTTVAIVNEIFDTAGEKTGEAEEDVEVPLMHAVPVMETIAERFDVDEVAPAGDRYGFRVDELHAFILRGLLAALETP